MSKKVVIIEDEDNLGKLIHSYLEQHNYHAVHVRDGAAALEEIRKTQPDAILMDLLLPGMHGFDLCRAIKADVKLMHIPLIVMTAVYKSAMDKLEIKRLGVDLFVEKPLNFGKLLKTLGKFTGAESQPEPKNEVVMEQQMQDLQQNYADQLPEKIEALEELWSDTLKNIGSVENRNRFAKMRRMVHTLIGSGETFGFKDITKHAQELELVLDMLIVEGDLTLESRKEEIERLLDHMRRHPLVTTGKQMRKMKI